ncbi:hypothetical protein HK102_012977 [Quaeritorhiza haematococci]|nr:hypothetical protein HK102_012977 [Quaeritorhiza haematococci]
MDRQHQPKSTQNVLFRSSAPTHPPSFPDTSPKRKGMTTDNPYTTPNASPPKKSKSDHKPTIVVAKPSLALSEVEVLLPGDNCPEHTRKLLERIPFKHRIVLESLVEPSGPLSWEQHLTKETVKGFLKEKDLDGVYAKIRAVCKEKEVPATGIGLGWGCEDGKGEEKDITWGLAIHKQDEKKEDGRYWGRISIERGGGNRAYRKFGSDRDATRRRNLAKEIRRYLEDHRLAGRIWKHFHFKESSRATFFATKGQSIKKYISVSTLRSWHIPFSTKNLDMSISKYLARFALCLSNTKASILIEDVRELDDTVSKTGEVMDDGCGFISWAAMMKLFEAIGEIMPSMVQGRFMQYKGTWIIDSESWGKPDIYIRPRKSQRKYSLDFAECDEHQRTFEVCRPAEARPGRINKQLVPMFEENGVPVEVLIEFVDRVVDGLERELSHFNPDIVLKFLQEKDYAANVRMGQWQMRSEKDEELYGPELVTFEKKALEQIRAGFTNKGCYFLAWLIRQIFHKLIQRMKKKINIPVDNSSWLMMAPDPCRVLEENEIFVQFSGSSMSRNPFALTGEALVSRNPAYFASDMQKVMCVYKPELARYYDVVFFSTKGDRPFASRLSGGDYDGDEALVIWEPKIVGSWTTRVGEAHPCPSGDGCGMISEFFSRNTKTVRDVVITNEGGRRTLHPDRLEDELFQMFLDAEDLVGIYAQRHLRLADRDGLNSPEVRELAHLCNHLLDARKQGLTLTEKGKKYFGSKRFIAETPNWMADEEQAVLSAKSTAGGVGVAPPDEERRIRKSTSATGMIFQAFDDRVAQYDKQLSGMLDGWSGVVGDRPVRPKDTEDIVEIHREFLKVCSQEIVLRLHIIKAKIQKLADTFYDEVVKDFKKIDMQMRWAEEEWMKIVGEVEDALAGVGSTTTPEDLYVKGLMRITGPPGASLTATFLATSMAMEVVPKRFLKSLERYTASPRKTPPALKRTTTPTNIPDSNSLTSPPTLPFPCWPWNINTIQRTLCMMKKFLVKQGESLERGNVIRSWNGGVCVVGREDLEKMGFTKAYVKQLKKELEEECRERSGELGGVGGPW